MNDPVIIPGWLFGIGLTLMAFLAKALYDRMREDAKAKKAPAKIAAGEMADRRHDICAVHSYLDGELKELKTDLKAGLERIYDLFETHRQQHRDEMYQKKQKEGAK